MSAEDGPDVDRPAGKRMTRSDGRTRVRVVTECRSVTVEPYQERTFLPGEELYMVRIGDNWWTGYDIDAAHIVPGSTVVVVDEDAGT